MKHLVSICIPLYNSEKYIMAALESATFQTYQPLEIVVCDDCSTDGSFEKAKAFINSFGKSPIMFRLHQNKQNLGMTENWNQVIKMAKGEYIKLIGGDDVLEPECIASQAEILKQDADISLVSCKKYVMNHKNKKLFSKGYPGQQGSHYGKDVAYRALKMGGTILGEPVTGLFRKKDFIATSGYDPKIRYHADMDFWIRLLLIGNYYYIKQPLVSFRIHKDSQTVKLNRDIVKDFGNMLEKFQEEPGWQDLNFSIIKWKVDIINRLRGLVIKLLA